MTRVRPTSAAERAHAHIRRAIISGDIAAGTMLSETELAATLSVSRTPVRAALARLQDEGWVSIYAQRGALVRVPDEAELRESSQLRHALEVAGVRTASTARRHDFLNHAARDIDAQARALNEDDFSLFVELSLRFHRNFVALADNSLMLSTYEKLQDRQRLAINLSAARIIGEPDTVLSEHRRLARAAADDDWVLFAERLAAHQQGPDPAPAPHSGEEV